MGPRNKCGDDNLRDSFLKLAPMGSCPRQAFADKDLLQHIDLARILFGKVIPPCGASPLANRHSTFHTTGEANDQIRLQDNAPAPWACLAGDAFKKQLGTEAA